MDRYKFEEVNSLDDAQVIALVYKTWPDEPPEYPGELHIWHIAIVNSDKKTLSHRPGILKQPEGPLDFNDVVRRYEDNYGDKLTIKFLKLQ